ncbi:MAG: glycoside hydrolase [Turicibacter sp.]
MKKILTSVAIAATTLLMMSGCEEDQEKGLTPNKTELAIKDFSFSVDPETFELNIESDGVVEIVSEPQSPMEISNLVDEGEHVSWTYKDLAIDIEIKKQDQYLDINIKSNTLEENEFSWPNVSGDAYLLPINQGKYFTSDDEIFKDYLNGETLKLIESFSMPFFGVEKEAFSIVYIATNSFNTDVVFETGEEIAFTLNHEFPAITEDRDYGFRIYVTPKNVVDVAKTYRNYLIETDQFKTLAQKAEDNPNIEKLYGAPHAYFWDRSVISEENIKWDKFREQMPVDVRLAVQRLLIEQVEDGKELAKAFDDLQTLDYVDQYTKNRIIKGLSEVLQLNDFYDSSLFKTIEPVASQLVTKGIENLNPVQLIELNKRLLAGALGSLVDPIEKWADANTVDVIQEMKDSGIDNLWLGLDDWQEGFIKPELIERASQLGYLIGTYDSYHSIHKPGEEKWITAKFDDLSLYEEATVTNKLGEKISGFQRVGRKLNPVLALPSVKDRVSKILNTGLPFNSWFLDTDATGEIYDDYSSAHITTEAQDIAARLERMAYLQSEWNMVVGSEGGNDFANQVLAFAHGIETPSFSWMDPDMNKNKESEYYVGRYFSNYGGVPEVFGKQIPIKDKYKLLFLDTAYTVPLYKLVYNESMITTHWWGWGTLKFEDEVENRMLYEILYNVPPLYHIDKVEWKKHKEAIVNHSKIYSDFSQKAIHEQMTDYQDLSQDRLLQMTRFGDTLQVIANFNTVEATYEDQHIPAKSALIIDGTNKTIYTP